MDDITERLQNVGVNYCILQSNQWQSDTDLNKISVLIIPNVETISGLQASVLSRWLNRGGKIMSLVRREIFRNLLCVINCDRYLGLTGPIPTPKLTPCGRLIWVN